MALGRSAILTLLIAATILVLATASQRHGDAIKRNLNSFTAGEAAKDISSDASLTAVATKRQYGSSCKMIMIVEIIAMAIMAMWKVPTVEVAIMKATMVAAMVPAAVPLARTLLTTEVLPFKVIIVMAIPTEGMLTWTPVPKTLLIITLLLPAIRLLTHLLISAGGGSAVPAPIPVPSGNTPSGSAGAGTAPATGSVPSQSGPVTPASSTLPGSLTSQNATSTAVPLNSTVPNPGSTLSPN